jgi:hypothetical protein
MMVAVLAAVGATRADVGSAAAPAVKGRDNVILRMAKQWRNPEQELGGTIWRYFETWQTDVVRLDSGELLRVEPYVYRKKTKSESNRKPGEVEILPAGKVVGSPFPPNGWQKIDFDDSVWSRQPGPFDAHYRSLALICVRRKFEVTDPAQVSDLTLDLSFQGGAIAYVNGQEIGRAELPAGPVAPDTLADPYPVETDQSGVKLWHGLIQPEWADEVFSKENAVNMRRILGSEPKATADRIIERYRQRFRSLVAKIPSSLLRKDVNVLAIEVHRAPAHAVMFTAPRANWAGDVQGEIATFGWNRCMVDDVRLTTTSGPDAVRPNVARPAGMQVWNASTLSKLLPTYFGDPNEPLRPIRMAGLPGGTYSAQFVVSSTKAVKDFKATVTALAGEQGAVLPASAVKLGYVQWEFFGGGQTGPAGVQFDTIEPVPPTELPGETPPFRWYGGSMPSYKVAFQPIWVTAKVPRDARPGQYAGKIVITAADAAPVEVPLQFRVAGDWTLPDPRDFKTLMGILESPDSVAMKYGVPLWSPAHWKLLDQVFELLGQIGTGDLYVPLLAKTNLSNEHSMVRWIKQPDGSYQHDFSIVERYLDTAIRRLKKPPRVVVWIHDRPFYRSEGQSMFVAGQKVPYAPEVELLPFTELDPATGQTHERNAPKWGTPEAREFWKPVFDGLRRILAQRGMERSMIFGAAVDGYIGPKCFADCKSLAPDVAWYSRAHHIYAIKNLSYFNWGSWGYSGSDVLTVNWEPDDTEAGHYRWRTATWKTSIPVTTGAWSMHQCAAPIMFRVAAESLLLGNSGTWDRNTPAIHGIGCQGADFWPVLKTDVPGYNFSYYRSLVDCYTYDNGIDHSFATITLLGPGKQGPAPTCHFRLLQEALQDAEVRMLVQDAILDHPEQLGPDLVRKCKQLCDDRTRRLHYASAWKPFFAKPYFPPVFDAAAWNSNSEQLYAATAEVAKALRTVRQEPPSSSERAAR